MDVTPVVDREPLRFAVNEDIFSGEYSFESVSRSGSGSFDEARNSPVGSVGGSDSAVPVSPFSVAPSTTSKFGYTAAGQQSMPISPSSAISFEEKPSRKASAKPTSMPSIRRDSAAEAYYVVPHNSDDSCGSITGGSISESESESDSTNTFMTKLWDSMNRKMSALSVFSDDSEGTLVGSSRRPSALEMDIDSRKPARFASESSLMPVVKEVEMDCALSGKSARQSLEREWVSVSAA